jgi:DNA-binding transcriptional LysR family regulator
MYFDWLNTFLEVAREKSFSRAGEKLHVTQPSISAQMKSLETHLGHRLFDRGGRKVTLTASGQNLPAICRGIPAAVQASAIFVGRPGANASGHTGGERE